MDQFTIVSLPKVNLALPSHKLELKYLQLPISLSPPCHSNLKTIQRERIYKESNGIFVKYRKKKKHVTLNDYLNKNRSYSTKQVRKSQQKKRSLNLAKKYDPIVLCQGSSNHVQTIKQMKIQKQILTNYSMKMQAVNMYKKLSKRNFRLQQHLKRLHRYHQISSLPGFICIPEKISYSLTRRNMQQKELIKSRFLNQKRSLGSLGEIVKDHSYFKNTLKDYKIEGWNMKQSKNGFGVELNS